MATISAANAVYMLSVATVFPSPVQLQGWAVDAAFDTEAVDAAETQVGVDGFGVAGWIPREITQTISFIAPSPSCDVFDTWMAAQDIAQDIFYAQGTIVIPSLSKQYNMSQGVLRRYPSAPNVRRVLQPRVFTVVWQPQPGVPAMIVSPV